MPGIDHFIRNVKAVNIPDIIGEVLDDNREDIKDLQRSQLLKGKKSDGNMIGKYKSEEYKKKRKARGLQVEYIDLRFTGDFQKDIFLDVRDKSMVIESADGKSGDLQKRFGENIFGLNKDSKAELVSEVLQPGAVQKIKSKILK